MFRDPPGVCKRSVSEVSWHAENPNKLAASYAINRFQQTPDKMRTCSYVWDLNNPNEPEVALNSPSPITNLCFNHKVFPTDKDIKNEMPNCTGNHHPKSQPSILKSSRKIKYSPQR